MEHEISQFLHRRFVDEDDNGDESPEKMVCFYFLYFLLLCIVKSIRVHSLLWLVRRRGKLELSVNFGAQHSGLFMDYTQTQAGLAHIMAW